MCRRKNAECLVSLETPMACGIGICFSCVTKVRQSDGGWDYKRTCVEGPIFDAQKKSGGARPDPFDAAYLVWRYRSEFGMEEIPALVQRVVLPVQVVIGKLLGKYRKFADAPAPVRRTISSSLAG